MKKTAKSKSRRHVSGFVSLLGRPNAGKSTLLNALIGSKVAIVSSKPQTTRAAVQAAMTAPGAQVVFLDTPGVHEAGTLLHKRMMQAVREALDERDLLIWVADATIEAGKEELEALRILERGAGAHAAPRFLVLNKVDRVRDKQRLLPLIEALRGVIPFDEVFPVSALTGEGLETLKTAVVAAMPEGPQYFPKDFLTDQPERHLAAELVREHVLHQTHQEVPHAVAVAVEKWEETPRLLRISATVYVERDGQKRILVGAGGAQIKRIGTAARIEMERLFDRRIFLELFVKVKAGWRDSQAFLDELDWRYTAGEKP